MSWYAIFEKESGRLVSLATEVAGKLCEELDHVLHEGEEMPNAAHWDPEQRAFVPAAVGEPAVPTPEPVAEAAPAEPAPEPAPEPDN